MNFYGDACYLLDMGILYHIMDEASRIALLREGDENFYIEYTGLWQ